MDFTGIEKREANMFTKIRETKRLKAYFKRTHFANDDKIKWLTKLYMNCAKLIDIYENGREPGTVKCPLCEDIMCVDCTHIVFTNMPCLDLIQTTGHCDWSDPDWAVKSIKRLERWKGIAYNLMTPFFEEGAKHFPFPS